MTGHTVITVTRHFDAALERLFDAWLDPTVARHFLFAADTGEIVECAIDARVDGRFRIVDRRDGEDVAHEGAFMEIVRPTRLSFVFAVPAHDPRETGVTIDIVPDGDGAQLTLGHSGVPDDSADKTREGWGKMLDQLAGALKSDV